jgi:hypothetical protein
MMSKNHAKQHGTNNAGLAKTVPTIFVKGVVPPPPPLLGCILLQQNGKENIMQEENGILHRVLKYAAGTLVEVVPDLLQPAAEAMIEEWTDIDLDRSCKCETLTINEQGDLEEAFQSESFATPYDVYSFENTLGIINVLAMNEDDAREHVQKILNECGERTGSTLNIDNTIKTIDVHVVIDGMGVVMTQLTEQELDRVAVQPFEYA